MRIPLLVATAIIALLLAACGSEDSDSEKAGSDFGDSISASEENPEETDEPPEAEIVDDAFVQGDEYLKGIGLWDVLDQSIDRSTALDSHTRW